MSILTAQTPVGTLAELVERLGDVPLERIRSFPYPGTATEEDVVRIERQENRLCELVAGALVEKAMGFRESLLAVAIASALREFVTRRNLGLVTGEGGMMRLFAGVVRIPDVAYVAWSRLPDGVVPDNPIPRLAPNLAIEVLSRSNTAAEMRTKRVEYFEAGVDLVWIVDPDQRRVTVYNAPEPGRSYGAGDTLDGAPVLPGFTLELKQLFAELDRCP